MPLIENESQPLRHESWNVNVSKCLLLPLIISEYICEDGLQPFSKYSVFFASENRVESQPCTYCTPNNNTFWLKIHARFFFILFISLNWNNCILICWSLSVSLMAKKLKKTKKSTDPRLATHSQLFLGQWSANQSDCELPLTCWPPADAHDRGNTWSLYWFGETDIQ